MQRYRQLCQRLTALLCAVLLNTGQNAWAEPAQIVLVIDDIGNDYSLGERAAQLPGAVHLSILPYSPFGAELAEMAAKQNKEVLVHLPMSNVHHLPLGNGAVTSQMDQASFEAQLDKSLAAVPYSKGVNNHMGSELTQMKEPMDWLMADLKKRGLYFIDSRTTSRSVAEKEALKHHLPVLRRNVFLDNQRSPDAIAGQFHTLIEKARSEGIAVGIGHPYPETLAFLEQVLPTLDEQSISLVLTSQLVSQHNILTCRSSQLQKACPTPFQIASQSRDVDPKVKNSAKKTSNKVAPK